MKDSVAGLFKTLFSDPDKFLEALTGYYHICIKFILNWTAPIKDDLFWLLPLIVLSSIIIFGLFKFLFFRKKQPSIKTEEKTGQIEEETVSEPPAEIEDVKKPALIKNIRSGLAKTRQALSSSMDSIFSGNKNLNDEMLEELEELLITSDVGVRTTMEIIEKISERSQEITNADELKTVLKEEILKYVNIEQKTPEVNAKPYVMVVIGVNGVGKTTTIGKLSSKFIAEGKKVLIVAADTFRAAASDQLTEWAKRSGADIVRHKDNSDPAAVAFDGIEAAIARKVDIVIIDTAGRLHTKKNLMEELKKIERTISGQIPDAPHETMMVVDATTGQNALTQAKLFNDAVGISSIALTKLDGTAKGGIVIGITNELNVPLKYIGVGEQIDDLQEFNAAEFTDAIL